LKLIFADSTRYFSFTASFIFFNFPNCYIWHWGGDERRLSHAFLTSSICYQPYLVKGSVRMQWHRSGLIATWEFYDEYIERKNGVEDQTSKKSVEEKDSEKKWGVMVVIKSLQFLSAIISAALKEATNHLHEAPTSGSAGPVNHGNMMHIGLVGINNQMSLLQDRYCFSKYSYGTTN